MLASLRATEAVIYPRFGFGVAGENASAVIDSRRARPLRCGEIEGSFRILDRSEILDVVPALYERVAHRRPGAITRPDWLWSRYLEEAIAGSEASFVAVHLDITGHPDGYVHYDVSWHDEFSEAPTGHGKIHELYGADAGVELAMWRYLLDIDLVNIWRADERPLDDVAKFVVADSRAYAIRAVGDEQWLRLLDVDVALGTRTYNATDRTVTIMVRDPLMANNPARGRSTAYRALPQSQCPLSDRPGLKTPPYECRGEMRGRSARCGVFCPIVRITRADRGPRTADYGPRSISSTHRAAPRMNSSSIRCG